MNDLLTSYVESRTVDATLGKAADGRATLTMVHDLPCPREEAWELVVDPERAVLWSPVVADRRLDQVGPATSRETPDADPVDCDVLAAVPPRELVQLWGSDELTWSLAAHETGHALGCRLTLRQTMEDPTQASALAAGWHLCLSSLEALAAGHRVARPVGSEAAGHYGWHQLRDGYDAVFAQQA